MGFMEEYMISPEKIKEFTIISYQNSTYTI